MATREYGPIAANFWKYSSRNSSDCLLWNAAVDDNGYGCLTLPTKYRCKSIRAHHFAYRVFHNLGFDGTFVLDHLCRNRRCVNPLHLEKVTRKENILRGVGATAMNARKTCCIRGHKLSGSNLIIDSRGYRVCRKCRRIRKIKWMDRQKCGS